MTEFEVEQDDAVIGQALRYSLAVILGVLLLAGTGLGWLWLTRQKPEVVAVQPVDLPKTREQSAKPVPNIPFVDITSAAGIKFVHENGARGEKLLPETMGGGCAIFDYNNDGHPDILFVNSKPWNWNKSAETPPPGLVLYENDGQGNFRDVTVAAGLAGPLYGQGCAVGDYDNDGLPDLFISCVAENQILDPQAKGPGPHRLFHNEGGRFVDVTAQAGVSGGPQDWGTSCGWFDFDNDGDLDLWVCHYLQWSREFDLKQGFTLTGQERAYGRPQVFNGTYCSLFRNDGAAGFTDVSQAAGLHVISRETGGPLGKSLGLSFCDINGDGWLDVIVTNDTVQNFLFLNQGNGTFQETAALNGIAFDASGAARGAMGIDIACARNDPRCYSVAIGNFSNEMSAYYVSLPESTQFIDEAVANGIGPNTRLLLTFGVLFADFDLDGWEDLFHANGHLEDEIAKVQKSQSYEQTPQLFWNAGPDSPTEFIPLLAAQVGADLVKPMVGRGASYADLDGDGDLDLLITATGQAPRLLRNDQQLGNRWLRLKLIGNGTTSNRDAIGARVQVFLEDGTVLTRLVSPTKSYLSQVELPVTFGLGPHDVQRVEIRWPDGTLQKLDDVALNSQLTVTQPGS